MKEENIVEFVAIRYDITNEVLLQKELEEKQKIIFLQSENGKFRSNVRKYCSSVEATFNRVNLSLFNLKKAFENENKKRLKILFKLKKSNTRNVKYY